MDRRLFTVLIVLLLCAIGFGFYRGWFVLGSSTSEPGTNKVNYNLTVDGDKVKSDAEMLKDKATGPTGKVTDNTQ